ncbi:MAG: NIL domain-containing protein [Nitrospinae bacterium]|nr:NIL domain-containing protein [Nitrospinota bacterium]
MANLKVRLTFSGETIKRPLIYEIGHMFKVVTNIRKADVDEKRGWVELEITGEGEEIEKAVEALKEKGVRVDPIEGDIVEG